MLVKFKRKTISNLEGYTQLKYEDMSMRIKKFSHMQATKINSLPP